jgi:hypothetical protein
MVRHLRIVYCSGTNVFPMPHVLVSNVIPTVCCKPQNHGTVVNTNLFSIQIFSLEFCSSRDIRNEVPHPYRNSHIHI